MSDILKKSLLLVATSAGVLSLSSAISESALAGPYVSASVSATNINGSSVSYGGEIGGAFANEVNLGATSVTPTNGTYAVTGFTVKLVRDNTASSDSVAAQVASDLATVNDFTNAANLNAYVTVVKAAAGANGLD